MDSDSLWHGSREYEGTENPHEAAEGDRVVGIFILWKSYCRWKGIPREELKREKFEERTLPDLEVIRKRDRKRKKREKEKKKRVVKKELWKKKNGAIIEKEEEVKKEQQEKKTEEGKWNWESECVPDQKELRPRTVKKLETPSFEEWEESESEAEEWEEDSEEARAEE
jgi:hypothetical protein